jgi:conjugative transposon TraN protein
MNRVLAMAFLLTSWQTSLFAQTTIQSGCLTVTCNKTTNIIFPYSIRRVNIGTRDIIGQIVKGADTILELKAVRKDFPETNLSVVTADGKFYSLILDYENEPARINIHYEKEGLPDRFTVRIPSGEMNQAELQTSTDKIITYEDNMHGPKQRKYKISLQLQGLFIEDAVIFLKIELNNRSNINYDVDMLRFYIRDKKKAKRTATQEIELTPLYAKGNHIKINCQTKEICVFALPKFTIQNGKYFVIEMIEKNGGRHLQLKLKNRHIMKAETID